MDTALLDRNVHQIDFNSLDAEAELRKINPRFMEAFDRLKGDHKVAWMRNYSIGSPVEEALVQYVLNKLTPAKISYSEVEKVRKAMAEEAAKGEDFDTPEREAEWEAKLQEARLKDNAHLEEIKEAGKAQFAGNTPVSEGTSNSGEGLEAIKNLGAKSVEKLHAAGIKTAEAFHTLTNEQLKDIVGPLVASKFSK